MVSSALPLPVCACYAQALPERDIKAAAMAMAQRFGVATARGRVSEDMIFGQEKSG